MNPRNVLPPSNSSEALHTQKRDVINAQTQLITETTAAIDQINTQKDQP